MFKFLNGLLPPSWKDAFCLVKNTHKIFTRGLVTNKLSLSNVRTEFFLKELYFLMVHLCGTRYQKHYVILPVCMLLKSLFLKSLLS